MTNLCASALQSAVYDALSANAALMGAITGLYDQPPESAAPPYLSMGETQVSPQLLKGGAGGQQIDFSLKLWSADQSQMEAKSLMALADGAVDAATLSVTGHDLIACSLKSADIVKGTGSSGNLYVATLTYSALLYGA